MNRWTGEEFEHEDGADDTDVLPVYKYPSNSKFIKKGTVGAEGFKPIEEDERHKEARLALANGLLDKLSKRERQVMELHLYHGLGARRIAKFFNLHYRTIENHIKNAREKLVQSNELRELFD